MHDEINEQGNLENKPEFSQPEITRPELNTSSLQNPPANPWNRNSLDLRKVTTGHLVLNRVCLLFD